MNSRAVAGAQLVEREVAREKQTSDGRKGGWSKEGGKKGIREQEDQRRRKGREEWLQSQ